jgi:hypothetical protein
MKPKRKASKPNPLKYVTRVDAERVHGWNVRWSPSMDWRNDTRSRLFSDGVYGGKLGAKKAALAFRDKTLRSLGQMDLLSHSGKVRAPFARHARNTSGIIGVSTGVLERKRRRYEYWTGYGMRDGERWRKMFSIPLYGEREAFRMACIERYKRHGELRVVGRLSDLPCRIPVPFKKTKAVA